MLQRYLKKYDKAKLKNQEGYNMKIYEFENLLDNGITTFEFEITKKVDYFFNEKEIENLIKNRA